MSAPSTPGLFFGIARTEYRLPHPPLHPSVILVIHAVLVCAFEILRQKSLDLAAAGEDEITDWLSEVIDNRLRKSGEVEGFNRDLYEHLPRSAHWKNYNGKSLNKAPDLCFKFREDEFAPLLVIPRHHGLFVEAKPVDGTHAAGGKYCDDGLVRFVNGDYAWAMQEAMMLAYARDGRTIADHLVPAMAEPARQQLLATVEMPAVHAPLAVPADPHTEAIHVSRHERAFRWTDGWGPACPITVYHLWHQCT